MSNLVSHLNPRPVLNQLTIAETFGIHILEKNHLFCEIILAYDIPILQMIITTYSGLVLLIFMIRVTPYRIKRVAWMNIGPEVLLVLIHLVIFIFAGDDITLVMTDNQRKNVGWVVVGLCSTLVAYNAIFIFTEQVFTFWNLIKLMARAICKKKKPESNKQRKKSTLRHRERKRYRDAFINRLERIWKIHQEMTV